jgi:hypothetical protein
VILNPKWLKIIPIMNKEQRELEEKEKKNYQKTRKKIL